MTILAVFGQNKSIIYNSLDCNAGLLRPCLKSRPPGMVAL
ncbi:hypothetical protein DSM14862_03821 (plasmid) [Sulfitobacter indolifex]|nr:hypothetical protein DSM14862_03821 [Sulfitobacter indolifex]